MPIFRVTYDIPDPVLPRWSIPLGSAPDEHGRTEFVLSVPLHRECEFHMAVGTDPHVISYDDAADSLWWH